MTLHPVLQQIFNDPDDASMVAAINRELTANGITIDLDDLRKHPEILAKAVPVMEQLLTTFEDNLRARNAIIQEMRETTVDPEIYLKEYRSLARHIKQGTDGAQGHAETLAHVLSLTARAKHIDEIFQLAQDESYGLSAMFLLYALPRFKRRKADFLPFLMQLLEHPTYGHFAIQILGRLKAQEAIPAITRFVNHPEWAGDAKTALRQLGVKIGGKADAKAIARYRKRFQAIPELPIPQLTFHDGVDELQQFFAAMALIPNLEGFGQVEANNVVCHVRDNLRWGDDDHDTDGLAFDITYHDHPGVLALEIWMAETDIADIAFIMPEALYQPVTHIHDTMNDAFDAEE